MAGKRVTEQKITLGEACRLLRISRHTLDKWLDRLKIEPTKHPYDFRYWQITDDQVQLIRDARAEMPGMARPALPTFTRQPLARPDPIPTDTPQAHRSDLALNRTYTSTGAAALPDGLVSVYDMARRHGVSISTVEKVYARGVLPCTIGRWNVGTAIIKYALNEEQQAAFLERWPQ